MSLVDKLPPVPAALQPVRDDELRVPAAEAVRRKVPAGSMRTRVDQLLRLRPDGLSADRSAGVDFAEKNPKLKGLVWDEIDGAKVLLAPFSRTMAINPSSIWRRRPSRRRRRKFGHHDHDHPRALVNTAEEWVLYNCSIALWSHTDKAKFRSRASTDCTIARIR